MSRPVGSAAAMTAPVPPAGGDGLDLGAIEARAAAATPGPWEADHNTPFSDELVGIFATDQKRYVLRVEDQCMVDDDQIARTPDAEFIAHARTDVPALVAEVRRLSAAPSFANPVPLTAGLLAEHGGTLPDGSWIADGPDAWRVHGGRALLTPLSELASTRRYSVVHLGAES